MKTYRTIVGMTLLFILVYVPVSVFSQTIDKGWKGLLPLKATKSDVEAVFGQPINVSDGSWNVVYRSDDNTVVTINYTTAPCKGNKHDLGTFEVKENLIHRYRVHFKNVVSVSSLRFKRSNFEYSTENDRFFYRQRVVGKSPLSGFGTTLEGYVVNGKEMISYIYFGPAYKKSQKLRCMRLNG